MGICSKCGEEHDGFHVICLKCQAKFKQWLKWATTIHRPIEEEAN